MNRLLSFYPVYVCCIKKVHTKASHFQYWYLDTGHPKYNKPCIIIRYGTISEHTTPWGIVICTDMMMVLMYR